MPEFCHECGAPIPDGGSCLDNLHALLFLESQLQGGPGEVAHFYAVACYGLQHPAGMNYTEETLAGLRTAVADALDGKVTIRPATAPELSCQPLHIERRIQRFWTQRSELQALC